MPDDSLPTDSASETNTIAVSGVPQSDVPQSDVPQSDVPTVDRPTVDTPTVDTPQVDTPNVAGPASGAAVVPSAPTAAAPAAILADGALSGSPRPISARSTLPPFDLGRLQPDTPSMIPTESTLRAPNLLLLLAAGLGALGDSLLYGQKVGLGATLLLLALPAALLFLGGIERRQINWTRLLPLLLVHTAFAALLSIHADPALTALNLAACAVLLGVLAVVYPDGRWNRLSVPAFLGAPFRTLGASLWKAATPVHDALESARHDGAGRRHLMAVLRGLALTIPVLALLLPLLASADAVFAGRLQTLTNLLRPELWGEPLGRLLLAIGAAWLIAGGMVWSLTRPADTEREPRDPVDHPLGFVEVATVLCAVLLVFGLFVQIQLAYLFGGAARVQSVPGLTYAAYARRGFGELTLVAALTTLLIQCLRAVARRDSRLQEVVFSGLSTGVVALTLVLLGSAWSRMNAYETAYGATPTRLWVDTFLIWLGLLLVWLIATLWSRPLTRAFAPGAFVAALGFGLTLNIQNPTRAAVIANLAAHRPDELTADGPAEETADYYVRAHQQKTKASMDARSDDGREGRKYLLCRLRDDLDSRGWGSWNLARERARRALVSLPPTPSQDASPDNGSGSD